MIDIEKLQSELDYDPITGTFRWKVSKPSIVKGSVTGVVDKTNGYLRIGWNHRVWLGHRLAWIYVHGAITRQTVIKQRNGDRADIRLDNLYSIGNSENMALQRRR